MLKQIVLLLLVCSVGQCALLGFLQKLKLEQDYETLAILVQSENKTEFMAIDFQLPRWRELNVAWLLLPPVATHCALHEISGKLLLLARVPPLRTRLDRQAMQLLVTCLGNHRDTRVIFHYADALTVPAQEQRTEELFRFCMRNFMLNVIAIFDDFAAEQRFYAYTQFPAFQVQLRPLSAPCFPNPLANMQGAPLRTLPDQSEPRSIVYRDEGGRIRITGYAAKLVQTFAGKHNATLVYPRPVAPELLYFYLDVFNMTMNGSLDLGMCLISPVKFNNPQHYTVIVEQAKWQPMIPLAPPLPVEQVFLLVFNAKFMALILALLLTVGIALSCAQRRRGIRCSPALLGRMLLAALATLLGQSSTCRGDLLPVRLLYACLFLAAIFVGTIFGAYLNTFLTSSPAPPEINSYDALLASAVRVRISRAEHSVLHLYTGPEFWRAYNAVFAIVPEVQEYYRLRKSHDTRYAYIVPSSLWAVFVEQYSRLPRPLFRVSERMYFTEGLYLAVPLHQHSIYRPAANRLVRQLQESGLLALWMRNAYYDMVSAGKIIPLRSAPAATLRPLSCADLYWIWWVCGAGLACASVAFAVERLIDRCAGRD